MRFKGTLVLLAVSLTVGLVYFFGILPHVRERNLKEELSRKFFRFESEKVEFLRIRNPQGMFDLVREQGEWRIKTPRSLPVDRKTIERISGVIRSGTMVKIIAADPSTLEDYGLQRPRITFSLGYEGKIDELALGDVNPAGTGVYAFAKGINAVFLIEREIAKVLDVGLYELRSKALFTFDPESVTRMKILRNKDVIDIRRGGSGWVMERPLSGKASDEAVQRYLTTVLNQRAEELYDDVFPKAGAYSKSMGIVLSSEGGVTYRIDVHYWGTGAREGVMAYQEGMAYSGRLAREFWSVVDIDVSYFRDRSLFQFREQDVRSIRVSRGAERYELIRKGDAWNLGDRKVNGKDATKFIWFLKSWNAAKLLGPSDAFQKQATTMEIMLRDKAGMTMGSLMVYGKTGDKPAGYTTEGQVDLYYAVSDNLNGPCIVSSSDLKGVPRKEEIIQ